MHWPSPLKPFAPQPDLPHPLTPAHQHLTAAPPANSFRPRLSPPPLAEPLDDVQAAALRAAGAAPVLVLSKELHSCQQVERKGGREEGHQWYGS